MSDLKGESDDPRSMGPVELGPSGEDPDLEETGPICHRCFRGRLIQAGTPNWQNRWYCRLCGKYMSL